MGAPQSQTAAPPRHQEEEDADKTKQAQSKQTINQPFSHNAPTSQEEKRCYLSAIVT